jgi:hypothetical protein
MMALEKRIQKTPSVGSLYVRIVPADINRLPLQHKIQSLLMGGVDALFWELYDAAARSAILNVFVTPLLAKLIRAKLAWGELRDWVEVASPLKEAQGWVCFFVRRPDWRSAVDELRRVAAAEEWRLEIAV